MPRLRSAPTNHHETNGKKRELHSAVESADSLHSTGRVSKRAKRRGNTLTHKNKHLIKKSELTNLKPDHKFLPNLPTIVESQENDEILAIKKSGSITSSKTGKMKTEIYSTMKKFVGAHVSASGSIDTAITNAINIGAKSFGLFLRNQRQWASKPLSRETAEKFRNACKENDFPMHLVLPHGSYLLNLGSPKEDVLTKSRATFIDELKRCDMLGIERYNFHPGSSCGEDRDLSIKQIAESINMAHNETCVVIAVLENMSKQGHTIGGDFNELASIIDLVEDKTRVGVCLDTCHAFAAGYNLAAKDGLDEMLKDFDEIVGLKYLKAMHLNDSKGDCGSHLDRHEHIGKGKIGINLFKRIMNDARFNDMPLILETPYIDDKGYEKEIKLLYSLIDN